MPRLSALLVVPLLFGVACASHDPAGRNDSIVAAGDSAYAASHRSIIAESLASVKSTAPAVLTDANILALAGDGDRLEIDVARMAVAKATSPAVKLYARQLLDDHGRAEVDVRALGKRLNLKEQPPAQDTTRQELQHLRQRFAKLPKGLAFDTAFVHHEIEDHLNDIKETKELEAKATNPELKKMLQDALPELQRHLDRARALAKSLVSKK